MTPTDFLRSRNIVDKESKDLIIGFDNGTSESLIELLESYHLLKANEPTRNESVEVCTNPDHKPAHSNTGYCSICKCVALIEYQT